MKLYHTVAFALIGWYLIVPPYSPELKAADTKKPYVYWLRFGKFDSADKCEAGRRYINREDVQRFAARTPKGRAEIQRLSDTAQRLAASKCIEEYDLVF